MDRRVQTRRNRAYPDCELIVRAILQTELVPDGPAARLRSRHQTEVSGYCWAASRLTGSHRNIRKRTWWQRTASPPLPTQRVTCYTNRNHLWLPKMNGIRRPPEISESRATLVVKLLVVHHEIVTDLANRSLLSAPVQPAFCRNHSLSAVKSMILRLFRRFQ